MTNYTSYSSPFSWRYSSPEMRTIWSEVNKRRLWRQIWLTLAEVQADFHLISSDQLDELRAQVNDVNVERSLEIESQIHHDLMAELRSYAEQCPRAGGSLHLGATSMDIEDNADVLRMRESLDLVLGKLSWLLSILADKINEWADLPLIAFTHLQPAEPSTLGYRICQYAQDLLEDHRSITRIRADLRGKGFKGAVGTGASFAELVGVENLSDFEARLSARLDLPFFPIATQTYPRKQDYRLVGSLAGMGASLNKLAFDLRFLQSPPIGEVSEPFAAKQVGSSAMPFKRNPVNAEKLDSLARALAQYPRLAWDNAAYSLLERTLDDSANRRSMLPEVFLISDELLITTIKIMDGLQVNQPAISKNLAAYGPFAALERVLMALGKAGADRQEMHERLREHAMVAWEAIQHGGENPLARRLFSDEDLLRYLDMHQLEDLMEVNNYLGDAPVRARQFASQVHAYLKDQ